MALRAYMDKNNNLRDGMDDASARSLTGDELFLPDFRDVGSLLVLVIVAELLAFVLVLAAPPDPDPWQALSLTSLFVQWIVLASAAGMAAFRPLLAGRGNAIAATVAYAWVLIVTAAVSYGGYRLLEPAALAGPREFVLRSLGVAGIVAAVALRYLYMQHEWKRRLESESAARIEALQARIRPHFLFNSLNTIAAMIEAAPKAAEAAVEDLADLFRAALAANSRLVPLCDELALARGYLALEHLRLGERLQVEWDVDTLPVDALVPPLTLQPLLENAVYHGIEPRVEGGLIRIAGRRAGGQLIIELSNPAGGGAGRRGIGMAQQNIRERLRLAFGRRARLAVETAYNRYRVELTLPYLNRSNENTDR